MNSTFNLDDTIAGIATPPGGAISIVRMSGGESLPILKKIFSCAPAVESHKVYYGWIHDNSKKIDEVLVTVMLAPRTFTRQDVVEINCHGSAYLASKILDLLLARGARAAWPGEFSARAFFNGRIDLSQAEAIMDMVNVSSENAMRAGANQLEGRLGRHIRKCSDTLLTILARIEMAIDYPEYDEADIMACEIIPQITEIEAEIQKLVASAKQGRLIREGIKVCLIGPPNSGKSSLLNALLMQDRAIVTNIPGTTRDVLSENVRIGDILLSLSDTAGIRESEDMVESLGVERSLKEAEMADLVVLVLDGSREIAAGELVQLIASRENLLAVINKQDLAQRLDKTLLAQHVDKSRIFEISAKNHTGMDELCAKISNMFFGGNITADDTPIITATRHKEALIHAAQALTSASMALSTGECIDFAAIDLAAAHTALSEITGETADESLINKIFSEFCLGK